MIIKNGNIVLEKDILQNVDLKICNGLITDIGKFNNCDDKIIYADGMYVAPGFIDIHTHGGYGGDFMDASNESFDKALKFHSDNGTTSILATSVTAPIEQIENMIKKSREYIKNDDLMCRILGVHIEGPFLSEKNKGAQHLSYLKTPDKDSYEFIINNSDIIKTVTIAPELDKAIEMTKELKSLGIIVCGGHDDGESEKILPVIEAGLTHCTHLWCAMSTVAMREGVRRIGLFELGLIDDRLSVEIIADNHHITPEMAKLVHKCKNDKLCIVSDSLRAGGMPPDNDKLYVLGNKNDKNSQKFIASKGVARLPDGTRYAGSIQPLSQMIKNLVFDSKIPLCDAIAAATIHPARVIGVENKIGIIEKGKVADICILDKTLNVKTVIKDGKNMRRC